MNDDGGLVNVVKELIERRPGQTAIWELSLNAQSQSPWSRGELGSLEARSTAWINRRHLPDRS